MVNAIATEICDRSSYLNESIHTIYFGGGTPSLLSSDQLAHLLKTIDENYQVDASAEITLEANPEDLNKTKAIELFKTGINRLSIGIQTFDESKLRWMNRIHDSAESFKSFESARAAGFNNISLDLIYAIPDHDRKQWEADLKAIAELGPEHVSLYGLTIEDRTVFGKWEEQNRLVQVPEDEAAQQYLFAIDYLKNRGYIQYEVSNFGKDGFHSRHNNAYWSGVPYLGVGPGAHSFNGESRRFNVRNNAKYLKSIHESLSYFETELLTKTQQINEQILTRLRTATGLNLDVLSQELTMDFEGMNASFIEEIKQQGLIEIRDRFLSLTPKGFLVADEIALKLFLPE